MSKQFYTSTEAASLIGLAPNTVNRRCSQGKIEASRDGFGTWVISADVVEAERQRIASKSNKMAPDKPRQKHEPTPGFLTVEQAAAEIGLHVRTLARRAYDGQIPGARRNGRVWEFSPEAVEHEKSRLAGYQVAAPKPKPVTKPAAKAPAMTIKSTPKFTASNAVASDAELAANRAKLAQVASNAKSALVVQPNGEMNTVARDFSKVKRK
jgi:hypothetical protein